MRCERSREDLIRFLLAWRIPLLTHVHFKSFQQRPGVAHAVEERNCDICLLVVPLVTSKCIGRHCRWCRPRDFSHTLGADRAPVKGHNVSPNLMNLATWLMNLAQIVLQLATTVHVMKNTIHTNCPRLREASLSREHENSRQLCSHV